MLQRTGGASHRRTPGGEPLKTAIDALELFYEGQHENHHVVGVFRGLSTLLDVLFTEIAVLELLGLIEDV
jgi:hypothetical protein